LVINLDPSKPQGWNQYVYVLNSPLVFVDPTGLIWGSLNGDVKWFETEKELQAAGFNVFTPPNWHYKDPTGKWVALNPDGPGSCRDGYDCTVDYFVSGWQYSTDPSTWIQNVRGVEDVSLEVYGIVFSGFSIIRHGGSVIFEQLAARGAQKAAEVFANGVTRKAIETAAADSGPAINFVTKLSQSPQIGKQLYAWEEGTVAGANQAIGYGQVYTAKIPKALVETLRSAGLVEDAMTSMPGVQAKALRFLPGASEFIVPFFK